MKNPVLHLFGIVRRALLGAGLFFASYWAFLGNSSWWTAGWVALVLCGISLELAAIANPGRGDTLSEHVWFVLSIPGWGKFLSYMLSAFLLWLIVHFVSHGKYG